MRRRRRRRKEETAAFTQQAECAFRRRTEGVLREEAEQMREEMNLRLILDFGGVSCTGENERKEFMRFAGAADNFALWRELNLPGSVLQVESMEIVDISWPVPGTTEEKISEKVEYGISMRRIADFLKKWLRRITGFKIMDRGNESLQIY